MGDLRLIVDHMKLDYKGPFEFNALCRLINAFLKERGFDVKQEKDFEMNTKKGKQIEWQISPWKKISDYARFIAKIRILVQDMVKIDAVKDKKKVKIDNGRMVLVIDGFIEFDYFNKWDEHPFFIFLRSLYDRFIYKAYTERFEQRLVYDMHHLYDRIERYLGMYRHYRVVTKVPHFAHH
jgi:hypothetical protein